MDKNVKKTTSLHRRSSLKVSKCVCDFRKAPFNLKSENVSSFKPEKKDDQQQNYRLLNAPLTGTKLI